MCLYEREREKEQEKILKIYLLQSHTTEYDIFYVFMWCDVTKSVLKNDTNYRYVICCVKIWGVFNISRHFTAYNYNIRFMCERISKVNTFYLTYYIVYFYSEVIF